MDAVKQNMEPAGPQPRSSRRRALWIVLGTIGLVVASLAVIVIPGEAAARKRIDLERVSVSQRIAILRSQRVLRPLYFEPGEEGNSWEPLMRALVVLDTLSAEEREVFPQLSGAENSKIDPDEADKVLIRIASQLEDLKRALRRRWTEPDYGYEQHVKLQAPHLRHDLGMARILTDAAALRHDQGRTEEAVDLLIMSWGLGDRIAVKGSLVTHLVEIVVFSIANNVLRKLLGEHRFSGTQLARLQRAVDLAASSRPDLLGALRTDDLMGRAAAIDIASGEMTVVDIPSGIAVAQQEMIRPSWRDCWSTQRMASTYLHVQDRFMEKLEATPPGPFEARQRALKHLEEYAIATSSRLHVLLKINVARAASNDTVSKAELGLARLALAIARYREDRGAFPGSLSDLVSSYLPDLPRDELSGKPFGYFARGDTATVYSAGFDGDDDGGRLNPDDDEEGDGDIVWTVKRRESAAK